MLKVMSVKGRIVSKQIMPRRFEVIYQCPCGGLVAFGAEGKRYCQGCQTMYQLRVMIGKA